MSSKRKYHSVFGRKDKNFDKSEISPNNVICISNPNEYTKKIKKTLNSLVVTIFIKENTTACYEMRKEFYKLSNRFTKTVFLEVDADNEDLLDLIKTEEISGIPSAVLNYNNNSVIKITGAFPQILKNSICKYSGEEDVAGQLIKEDSIPEGTEDLRYYVDFNKSECLNTVNDSIYFDFLDKKPNSKMISDCDDQIIFGIGFTQDVKICSIRINGPEDKGPSSLKLFVNVPSMGFDDVANFQFVQEVQLEPEHLKGKDIPLNKIKFNKVKNIHIFIPGNQSNDDVTEIDSLSIFGEPQNKKLGVAGYTIGGQDNDDEHVKTIIPVELE